MYLRNTLKPSTHLRLGPRSLFQVFPTKTLYVFIFSPTRIARLAQLIRLELTIRVTFGDHKS